MKRIVVLLAVMAFAAGVVPAFAAEGSRAKEKSLFQIVYDSMNKPCEPCKTKMQPDKVTIFQELSDSIKEGSAKAKKTSLRGTK